MENFKIMSVDEFNKIEMQLYNEKVDEWRNSNTYNIIPQLAFFGFRNQDGSLRKTGYVATSRKHHLYNKTKKGLLKMIS